MHRLILAALAATAFSTLATGCGGGGEGPLSDSGVATASAGTAPAAPDGLKVLRKGNSAEPQTLDPHKAEGVPSSNVLRDLFEGLTTTAPDGTVVPGAAERWTISDDGRLYTFYIRADARWSDGSPVTAADFEYGLKRSADPATLSKYSQILAPIENAEAVVRGELPADALGVRALDERTLEIRLKGPTPYFLGLLTHSTTYPVNRANVERDGDRFSRPGVLVSNGAYRLVEWTVQSHIRLERNTHYWNNAATRIDAVTYFPLENQSTELKRYRAGELDWTYELPNRQIDWLRKNLADDLRISPYLGVYYYGFNVTRPPFKDNPGLRRALAMTIDRETITERVTGVGEIPAYGFVPPVSDYTGQRVEWADWPREQRLAEARRLYAEAGYSQDKPLEISLMYNTNENHKAIAVAVASMWKRHLGVEVSLLNQEWKVFLKTRKQKIDTQVFRAGWIGDYNDPNTFAELMHSANGLNDPGYVNPRYDELVDGAAVEVDRERRRGMLEEAEAELLRDLPIAPIYFYVTKRLVKPYVVGYEDNIMNHHYTKDLDLVVQ